MHYYGTRLSENISKREPEGYLLCLNVPVARTGIQEYLPSELGLPGTGRLIPVFRPEEEVFSPETVASFEGMPVTNDHPPEGVDISNIRALQQGHAHNVRRGSGEASDLLLADLIITDPKLITAILEEGKREISCGYTYELCEENGRYIQRKIRGNHVAVVDAGRAGSRVSIKDEQPPALQRGMRRSHHDPIDERRKNMMNKSLSKVLARLAKDGDTDTVAEIIGEMMESAEPEALPELPAQESAPEAGEETAEAPLAENAENVIAVDSESLAAILERLDRIIRVLEPSIADEGAEREIAGLLGEMAEAVARGESDPVAGEVTAALEEILDPADPLFPDPAEDEENGLPEVLQTADALRAAVSAVRPVLAKMSRKQRCRVAGDVASRLRRMNGRRTADADVYAALASAGRRTAPASAELGRRIMEKRNAAYMKNRPGQ